MNAYTSDCCGADIDPDIGICMSCLEHAAAIDNEEEQRIDDALYLLQTSSLRDDDGGLKQEILSGEVTEERWSEIFLQLRANQLRPIDLPNFNQTDWAESYKRNF